MGGREEREEVEVVVWEFWGFSRWRRGGGGDTGGASDRIGKQLLSGFWAVVGGYLALGGFHSRG